VSWKNISRCIWPHAGEKMKRKKAASLGAAHTGASIESRKLDFWALCKRFCFNLAELN
jgi:hypothetical protein